MKLNSIIFHTPRLKELRQFYEGKLKLSTGIFLKDGLEVPDFSDKYVNYPLDGVLLCFEQDEKRTDLGTVVMNVRDFPALKKRLENEGIEITGSTAHYFKIKDPEGRSIIFEPIT